MHTTLHEYPTGLIFCIQPIPHLAILPEHTLSNAGQQNDWVLIDDWLA
jgi:hypothetical protein